MKTGIFLSYKGIGANLLHLSYCHQIAERFGPVTIITLCSKLDEILKTDSKIKEVIYLSNKYHDRDFTIAAKKLVDLAGITYRQFKPLNQAPEITFEEKK